MRVICIILLTFLSAFVYFGLMFLLCRYIILSFKKKIERNIIKIREEHVRNYQALLQTKEWENKRIKILDRDHYRCAYCGNIHHLHVHHKYYSAYPNGALVDPWNYPDDALITLCAYHHQRIHALRKIKVYYRRYTDNY